MRKFNVGRPINGISLNGLEWLLDDNGDAMVFESVYLAKKFLKENGHEDWTDDELEDSYVFEPVFDDVDSLIKEYEVTNLLDTKLSVKEFVTSKCGAPEAVCDSISEFIEDNAKYSSEIILQEDDDELGLIIDAYEGDGNNTDSRTIWWQDYELPF